MFAKIPRCAVTKSLLLLKATLVSLFYMTITAYFMTKSCSKNRRNETRKGSAENYAGGL